MPEFIFDREEHEEYGTYGWKMQGKPHFEPFQGMAVAHDCMEHFADDDGSIGHECMALGASLIVRDMEMYYFYKGRHNANPAENVASDYTELYNLFNQGTRFYKAEDEFYKPLKDKDLEACVQVIKRKAIENVRENNDVSAVEATSFVKKSLPWIRKGILMAQDKYKDWSSMALVEAFMKIEKEANNALEDSVLIQLRVNIDMEECSVNVIAEEFVDEYSP